MFSLSFAMTMPLHAAQSVLVVLTKPYFQSLVLQKRSDLFEKAKIPNIQIFWSL